MLRRNLQLLPILNSSKLVLSFGLCTLSAGVLYVFLKWQSGSKGQTQKLTTIKMVVSNEQLSLLLGRSGAKVTLIEERTHTKIIFSEKDDANGYCAITGARDDVNNARELVLKEVERSCTTKEELEKSQNVSDMICEDVGKEPTCMTVATVTGKPGVPDLATGNRQEVIETQKIIAEDSEEKNEIRQVEKDLVPLYVSAVASPSKFWVQLIGPQLKTLDDLLQTMTNYYSEKVNRDLHIIEKPYVGQIVAAAYKYDWKWYRAAIVSINPNLFNPEEIIIDLYFVDYGDSEYSDINQIFELCSDFLTHIPFQAVEYSLANVKPTPLNSNWNTSSIEKFEELTQVGKNKTLMSRVVAYKQRPSDVIGSISSEGSLKPVVELLEIVEDGEVNIGDVMISQGFALPTNEQSAHLP